MSVPFFFQPDYSIHYFFVVFVCWLVLIRPATKRPRAVDERTTVVPPRRSRERKKRLFNLVVCFPFFVLGFHRPSEQFPEGTKKKRTMEEFEFGGPRVARGVPCFVFFVCVDFLCFFREQLASNGPRKHPTIIFRDQGDRPRSAAGIRSVRSAHRRRNDDRSGTKRYERKTKQTNETKWPRTFERCSVDQSPPFVFLCTISGQKRRKLLDINSTTPK